MAKRLGAQIVLVSPGYLNVVQARAREYCHQTRCGSGAVWLRIPGAVQAIAAAARSIGEEPDEVWCAGGSGVLARGLAQAWPNASRHVVQIGRTLSAKDVAGAMIHEYPKPFKWATKNAAAIPERPALRRQGVGDLPCPEGVGARALLERHRTGTTLTWLTDNRVIGRRQSQRSDNFRQTYLGQTSDEIRRRIELP